MQEEAKREDERREQMRIEQERQRSIYEQRQRRPELEAKELNQTYYTFYSMIIEKYQKLDRLLLGGDPNEVAEGDLQMRAIL